MVRISNPFLKANAILHSFDNCMFFGDKLNKQQSPEKSGKGFPNYLSGFLICIAHISKIMEKLYIDLPHLFEIARKCTLDFVIE
jgi:hypothetical protein